MTGRRFNFVTVALLILCALALPLAAQQFDPGMWGKNSPGVELAAHEGPRQHTASGTVLVYNLIGKGFPADKTYDLWFWIPGEKPGKAIADVSFDKRGVLVCSGKPGSCQGSGLDDPINIKTKAVLGEPKRFAVVSTDGRVAGFAEAVPFPIEASDKNCKLSVVRQSALADDVIVRASGFTPYEMLTVKMNSGPEGTTHSPTASPDGDWLAVIGTKVAGQSSGVANIQVSGHGCSVSVSFAWGEGSAKQQ
ncbi:MAG: hypothetical protein ACLPPV_23120 [Candidatus Korobacteraceae bacterium]